MATKQWVHFSGAFIEATVTDKACVVDGWVSEVRSKYNGQPIMVGLDCEWYPPTSIGETNKTATLQLCVDTKCLIIQLFFIDYIPQSIKSFLTDPNITFVGVEVGDDVVKLRGEYGIGNSGTRSSDIQALAMARWPWRFYRKPGLKKLAREIAGLEMEKPLHVCRSNWEARVLDEKQIEYACIDAYASYRIGKKLLKDV